MGKSSIHIVPVKGGSESHNQRLKALSYVRSDLSYLNSSFHLKSIQEAKNFAERNCKEKTGRKMQDKATPIREGVLLINKHHTAEDLKRLSRVLEQRFGIKTIQGYCHKDEGHYDKITNEWRPNYHAHMVFDWTNHQTGKSIKLNREDMSEFQSIVAGELNLERGHNSSIKHLNAVQFKTQQEIRNLQNLHQLKNGLTEAQKVIEQAIPLKKEIDGLKSDKKRLEEENTLLRANKNHLEKKIEVGRSELKQLEEQKTNRGFKL